MSKELNALRHDLVEIATIAYGRGWRENTSGGEGHIGKIGNMIVKFNTHGGEYGNLGTLSSALREKMLASSDELRATIIGIIDKALGLGGDGAEGSEELKAMKAALTQGKGRDLLTRKTAAKAVTEIAKFIDGAKPEFKTELSGVSLKKSVWNEAKMNSKGAYVRSAKDTRAAFESQYDDFNRREAVSPAQMKRLRTFAALACGKDGSRGGGSGYMGVRSDGTAVKFLTHPGERSAFFGSKRTLPDSVVEASAKMKSELLDLAESFQRRAEVEKLFDAYQNDAANRGRPYTRELVAKVIDAITKDNLAKTESGERFDWENIRHADTVGDTTVEAVFADELVDSIMKDVWERPETDPQTCGYARTMAVEGDVRQDLGKVLSVFSHTGDDEVSRRSAFQAFEEDVARGCKLFIDGKDVLDVEGSLETAIDEFFKSDAANGAAAKNAVVQLASQQLHGAFQPMLAGCTEAKSGIAVKSPFPFKFTCTNDVDGASMESRLSRDSAGAYHLEVRFSGAVLRLLDGGRNFMETGSNPTKMSVSLTLDLSFNEQGAAVVTVAKGGSISVEIPPEAEPEAHGGRTDRFQSHQMTIRSLARDIRETEVKLGNITNEDAKKFDDLVKKFANEEAAASGLDVSKFKNEGALQSSLVRLMDSVKNRPPEAEADVVDTGDTGENLTSPLDVLDKKAKALLDLYTGELTDLEVERFKASVERRKEAIRNGDCVLDDDLPGEVAADKLNRREEKLQTLIHECALILGPHRRKMAVISTLCQEAKGGSETKRVRMHTDVEEIFDGKVKTYRQAKIFLPADQVVKDVVAADIGKFAEEAEAEAKARRIETIRAVTDSKIAQVDDMIHNTFHRVVKLSNPDAQYPADQIDKFHKRVEADVLHRAEKTVADDEATRKELQEMVERRAQEVFPTWKLRFAQNQES